MCLNNIVQFKKPEDDKDEFDALLEHLREDTDQLIFIRLTKDGHLNLGHTPLDVKDLIYMWYHIQTYIHNLIESGHD